MKYRKKPVVVEAEQWSGQKMEGVTIRANGVYGYIETLEGGHIVDRGDWVITGVKGEKYPCKPDIFKISYEPVISCNWCDCEYPDHSCRECHLDNTEIACSKNEGLCNDCRVIQEGK